MKHASLRRLFGLALSLPLVVVAVACGDDVGGGISSEGGLSGGPPHAGGLLDPPTAGLSSSNGGSTGIPSAEGGGTTTNTGGDGGGSTPGGGPTCSTSTSGCFCSRVYDIADTCGFPSEGGCDESVVSECAEVAGVAACTQAIDAYLDCVETTCDVQFCSEQGGGTVDDGPSDRADTPSSGSVGN